MNIDRKCDNCTYYPCLRIDCSHENVCNQHEFEHEKIIREVDNHIPRID